MGAYNCDPVAKIKIGAYIDGGALFCVGADFMVVTNTWG